MDIFFSNGSGSRYVGKSGKGMKERNLDAFVNATTYCKEFKWM